jgi:hypothetical protein
MKSCFASPSPGESCRPGRSTPRTTTKKDSLTTTTTPTRGTTTTPNTPARTATTNSTLRLPVLLLSNNPRPPIPRVWPAHTARTVALIPNQAQNNDAGPDYEYRQAEENRLAEEAEARRAAGNVSGEPAPPGYDMAVQPTGNGVQGGEFGFLTSRTAFFFIQRT